MRIRKPLPPTVLQVSQMALFFAALTAVELSIAPFSGAGWLWFIVDWYYGGASLALLILCARVTQYPHAVLFLAVCKGLLGLVFLAQGGLLMVLYEVVPPVALYVVLSSSRTRGESLAADLVGGALYGCAAGFVFFFLVVGVVGMEFPEWFMWLRILSILLSCTMGGYLGWKAESRVAERG